MQTLFSDRNLPAVPAPSVSREREELGGVTGGGREKKKITSLLIQQKQAVSLWIGFLLNGSPKPQTAMPGSYPPKSQKSLYGFVLLREGCYCHLFLVSFFVFFFSSLDRNIPKQKA